MNFIKPTDSLPQEVKQFRADGSSFRKMEPVLVITERNIFQIAYYFPEHFKTIEFEDWEDYSEKDFPYTEDDLENEIVWLRPGFYLEIDCPACDQSIWEPIDVKYWSELPEKPKHSDLPPTTAPGQPAGQ